MMKVTINKGKLLFEAKENYYKPKDSRFNNKVHSFFCNGEEWK